MISREALEKLATQYQTGVFPNIVREYFQHIFLSKLYKLPEAEKVLFKGGTALRTVYGSPRFSEDLDFSVFGMAQHDLKKFVEDLFVKVFAKIEQLGINVEIGEKSDETSGGYFGVATFEVLDFQPVGVEINISARNGRSMNGEVDSVANDFVPTYTLIHLSQDELVEEKVFGALLERKKPRDFYDLYFIMRKGMLTPGQKKRLAGLKNEILADAKNINFRGELGAFLPADQQAIIRDFHRALEDEIKRQIV
ncbi:MAG: nucleotidyl transferase AbiEii/AbiGii toxin family protein [Candidatus Doudnabacteria bacterium]|nr:nucleotidyl transferase AbiEii/AbiGii toxin family protein [Candidatus Doudnabacteria bacterium]